MRKITDGPHRNKQRTKDNLIKAVGQLLQDEGFSGITISKVADRAKMDRKLIYSYFGNLEGLLKAYLESRDYWKINPDDVEGIVQSTQKDSGKSLAYQVLEDQFDSLISNEEVRRIITWGLSEKSTLLKDLDLRRENTGEQILKAVFDEHFKDRATHFRAIYGLLMGGIYYLTLHAKVQENTFCGIDFQQPAGQEELKKAVKQIIDMLYK